MRIIHTADWHLGDWLGRNDRTQDLEARVERVAQLCQEHQAEVLLIAGDLFSEQAGVEEMTNSLQHLRKQFLEFFARGGTILAVTGNHDVHKRIEMVRAGMSLAVPNAGQGRELQGGRMYLLNTQAVVRLADSTGNRVQFVLLPYPYPSRYNIPPELAKTPEEENRNLRAVVANWLARRPSDPNFDQTLPTVLVAHLHVRGSEMHTTYKIRESDDVLFEFGELHAEWRYVALGHIHKPQCLGGSETVRYSGSLDRFDFGETHSDHGVLLFDVRGAEPVKPVRLPIPPTPFHTIEIRDPETELATLTELYPDHDSALVRLRIHPPGGTQSRDEILRQLKRLFPRWHSIEWLEVERADRERPQMRFDPKDGFESTVRRFLDEQLQGQPDREKLLALAEEFLKTGGGS